MAFLNIQNNTLNISINLCNGTFKYFFKNYKGLLFPSIGRPCYSQKYPEFMDKKFRKAATASTCYEKFSGSYSSIFDSKSKNFENCFKLEYKDRINILRLTVLTIIPLLNIATLY